MIKKTDEKLIDSIEEAMEHNRYLENSDKEGQKHVIRIVVLMILVPVYLLILIGQATGRIPEAALGVFAQLEVAISILMVILARKPGYFAALGVNIIGTSTLLFLILFHFVSIQSIAGVATYLISIIICTVLRSYIKRLKKSLTELKIRNAQMISLTDEVTAAYEEAKASNTELLESNLIISQNEEKLYHMAYYDQLTDIPNRSLLTKKVSEQISNNHPFYLCIIDLQNFKMINDTKGHNIGDQVLHTIAKRLEENLGEEELVARFGGDQFALILDNASKMLVLDDYIENLRKMVLSPIAIEETEISFYISIGIAKFPGDGLTAQEVIQSADIALYEAKNAGKHTCVAYEHYMVERIVERSEYERNLSRALLNNEFYMMYQPQYATDGKSLRGFEALVRWESPNKGSVSPASFIPIAEENGLIIKLGTWIMRESILKLKSLMDQYQADIIMSINVSAIQFQDDHFIDTVRNILQETGVEGKNIEFEITESVFMGSLDSVKETLNQIKQSGISIALDDFGTGFSSLSYLRDLPIDTLKIDKSFVDIIKDSNKNNDVVGSIIELAHSMHIEVVAEGVEYTNQLDYLESKKCETIQGYLFGKPVSGIDCTNVVLNAIGA